MILLESCFSLQLNFYLIRFTFMKSGIFFFFVLFFVCCNQPHSDLDQSSFKDSIVNMHLAMIRSLDYYDTLDEDYRMLQAYMDDDTGYFINVKRNMEQYEEELKKYPPLDTCVRLLKLSELNVDEAYRFSHGQSFCDFGQRITISRLADTIRLHYVEYGATDKDQKMKYYDQEGNIKVGPGCAVVKNFERSLSMEDWKDLDRLAYDADYWGLKENEYDLCLDGSHWSIDAYTRKGRYPGNRHIHSVSRHCYGSKGFRELGRYFLRLSGEKTMCERFF